MNNNRLLIVVIFVFLGFLTLVFRLYNVQILHNVEYGAYGEVQNKAVQTIQAQRGLIYDRNGLLLSFNKNEVSFFVDVKSAGKNDKKKIAAIFSSELGNSSDYYLEMMKLQKSRNVCIAKKVSAEKALALKKLRINGLKFEDDPSRVYQYDNFASHILGYVNASFYGADGIEKYFNNELKGVDGSRIILKDARGEMITVVEESINPQAPGNSIYLTIDKTYQTILENAIKKAAVGNAAENAIGIIMDPTNGRILALTNSEDYNPNFYNTCSDSVKRNKVISDTYEPGSTFKAISLSAFLDKKICSPEDKVFGENGSYKFKNVTIRDSHNSGWMTVKDVFVHSSNIGMSKLSQRIDPQSFYLYLRDFGIGNYTDIPLPGEAKGNLKKPETWTDYTQSSLSFGYEVAVTPIQLTAAYAAIINGGKLFQPQLVDKVVTNEGKTISSFQPKFIRQVIKEETSKLMREFFVAAIEDGTGKKAKLTSCTAGGKTGTSRKLVDGKYSTQNYNSSFIGFFPAENPKYLIYVLVNAPKQNSYYGGDVAAPVFTEVATKILSLNPGLINQQNGKKEETQYSYAGNKDVKQVELVFASSVQPQSKVDEIDYSKKVMPNLEGKSLREAIKILSMFKIKCEIAGNGKIISQSILAGASIKKGMFCKLTAQNETNGIALY
ncbi:MAG: transpeptidase family protein [Ignavibacteriaceae bacterium]|nr:transpeptidase family protein [Ignavibacteriaceae bacterium]